MAVFLPELCRTGFVSIFLLDYPVIEACQYSDWILVRIMNSCWNPNWMSDSNGFASIPVKILTAVEIVTSDRITREVRLDSCLGFLLDSFKRILIWFGIKSESLLDSYPNFDKIFSGILTGWPSDQISLRIAFRIFLDLVWILLDVLHRFLLESI